MLWKFSVPILFWKYWILSTQQTSPFMQAYDADVNHTWVVFSCRFSPKGRKETGNVRAILGLTTENKRGPGDGKKKICSFLGWLNNKRVLSQWNCFFEGMFFYAHIQHLKYLRKKNCTHLSWVYGQMLMR